MMNKINYQVMMEQLIARYCPPLDSAAEGSKPPRLLLHSCCGPCSSYCLQCLSAYFLVTVRYYNPNIYPPEEYRVRAAEQERFIREFPTKYPVSFVEGTYDTGLFYEAVKGYEEEKEGQGRCMICYEMRLRDSAAYAKEHGYDFFTTTLSVSPMKNAQKLNEIGEKLSAEYQIKYLYSDFKKKDGYRKSTELSKQYHMYRQYYCGCVYSKNQRDKEIAAKALEENRK